VIASSDREDLTGRAAEHANRPRKTNKNKICMECFESSKFGRCPKRTSSFSFPTFLVTSSLHEQETDVRTRPIGHKTLEEICKPRADMGKEEVVRERERARERERERERE